MCFEGEGPVACGRSSVYIASIYGGILQGISKFVTYESHN